MLLWILSSTVSLQQNSEMIWLLCKERKAISKTITFPGSLIYVYMGQTSNALRERNRVHKTMWDKQAMHWGKGTGYTNYVGQTSNVLRERNRVHTLCGTNKQCIEGKEQGTQTTDSASRHLPIHYKVMHFFKINSPNPALMDNKEFYFIKKPNPNSIQL